MWWKPFLLSFAFIGSCNTDGDGLRFFDDEDPEGLWTGTLTRDGADTAVRAFVRGGDLLVFDSVGGVVLRGPVTVSGDELTARATLYEADGADIASARGTIELDGTVDERSRITANFTDSDGVRDRLSLVYDSNHERDSSLDLVAGTWSRTIGTETLTLTVADTGTLDGSDSAGCVYTGSISTIDPDFNIYGLTVTITICVAKSGTYTGYGQLQDADDTLVLAFSSFNVPRADAETLTRQ